MKAQSEVLGAVLIAAILIAALISAYLWGIPLIQKTGDQTKVEKASQDMKELARAIEYVAANKGSRELSVNIDGLLIVKNDSIEQLIESRIPYVSTSKWAILNENDYSGTFLSPEGYGLIGRDKAAVLFAKAQKTGEKFVNTFKIDFRPMEEINSKFGSEIILKGVYGNYNAGKKIVVSYDSDQIIPGASKSGGDLKKIFLVVKIF